MTNQYTWVQWNRHKKIYDALIAGALVMYLLVFVGVGKAMFRGEDAFSDEVLVLRALGTAALVLLHVILCIGPLARLDPRFSALLYNRRHLGVTMFLVGLAHGAFALVYYGGFGAENPLVALLWPAGSGFSVDTFPFALPGFVALLILFVMAATSHDFWLANLSAPVWKTLHMFVYVAYGLLVLHVAFGVLQHERSLVYPLLLGAGVLVVGSLHVVVGLRDARLDAGATPVEPDVGWIDVGSVDEIPEDRAKTVCLRGRERVAVFRTGGRIGAVSDVCAHQAGPLGEGKVIDGCITCPWHGYQYRPEDGQSPPPFTERIPTYEVRLEGRRILLNPDPLPPGTPREMAPIQEERDPGAPGEGP